MPTISDSVAESITFADAVSASGGAIGVTVNETITFIDSFNELPFTNFSRFVNPYPEYQDYNGLPYAEGFLYTYAHSTDDLLATYADQALTIPNANPIMLDARGAPGNMWMIPSASYKAILNDFNGDQIWMREWIVPPISSPPVSPPPPSPPTACQIANVLDLITQQPFAAYSTRKLKAAYAGFALRVRRDSDAMLLDIGFGVDCSLDTSALLTFCAGTNCHLAIWYDQSGNGNNVVAFAGDAAHTPLIVTGGALSVTVGGHTATSSVTAPTGGNWLEEKFTGFPVDQGSIFAVGNATSGGTPHVESWRNLPAICGADADFSGNGNAVGISFAQTAGGPITLVPSMVGWRYQGIVVGFEIDMHTEISYTFGTGTSSNFVLRFNVADAPNVMKAYINGGMPSINTNPALNNGPTVSFTVGLGGNHVITLPFVGTIAEVLAFSSELTLPNSNILGPNQALYWSLPSWSNISI